MKHFFIRFTENIEVDIERGTSILTESNNEVTEGLCAFWGGETIEETRAKAIKLSRIVSQPGASYVIFKSLENIHAKKGTLGTIAWADEIEVIEKATV